MAVLVTRPDVEGAQLCTMLQHQGIKSLHHPLIKIEPSLSIAGFDTALQRADIVIAVSQHAVNHAHHYLEKYSKKWPDSCVYLAVGQKTGQRLSKLSQQKVHYPSQSDSEHLLAMDVLKQVSNKKIVILRGNGGRELIYETLKQRQAKVEYKETYQRIPIDFIPENRISEWQEAKVSQLVVTSSDQLRHLLAPLTPAQTQWICSLTLYVPSERITRQAKELGFTQIINVGAASNQELLAALRLNKQDD